MTSLAVVNTSTPEPYEGDVDDESFQRRSSISGSEFKHMAADYLETLDVVYIERAHRVGIYEVEGIIRGRNGQQYIVLVHGVPEGSSDRPGLIRTDTIKKLGFDASKIRRLKPLPIVVLTSDLPKPSPKGTAHTMLADCANDIWDIVAITGDLNGWQRISRYLHETPIPAQLPAPWRNSPSHHQPSLFETHQDLEIPMTVNAIGQISYGATPDDGTEEEY